jgi:hypothetical protein
MLKIKNGYRYILLYELESLPNLHSLTVESICGGISKCSFPKLKWLVLTSCRNTKWIEVIFKKI